MSISGDNLTVDTELQRRVRSGLFPASSMRRSWLPPNKLEPGLMVGRALLPNPSPPVLPHCQPKSLLPDSRPGMIDGGGKGGGASTFEFGMDIGPCDLENGIEAFEEGRVAWRGLS